MRYILLEIRFLGRVMGLGADEGRSAPGITVLVARTKAIVMGCEWG